MAKRKITDPVFGKLTFDVLWEGTVTLEPYGKVKLEVDSGPKENPPTDKQREAFINLRALFPGLQQKIDAAIFAYYCAHRKKYLPMAIEPEVEVPVLKGVGELSKILTSGPALMIPVQRAGRAMAVLSWSVTFDDEHGLEVEIVDGKPVVG